MKYSFLIKSVFFTIGLFIIHSMAYAQVDSIVSLTKKSYMVPMRDGVKLFTIVLTPTNTTGQVPILIERTPYGCDIPLADDSILPVSRLAGFYQSLLKGGYIYVFQDIRGKFKSEGQFEMCRPLYHLKDSSKTDESTDAYDTVDWLVKNIKNNNGRAGILGISYPGLMALQACVDPHPALKASAPQAAPADMFVGDDFHHNGAFRLSYGMEYSYMVENAKQTNSDFPFTQFDLYDWYLKLGPLTNVNTRYFRNRIPTWNNFIKHPDYDKFWQHQSNLKNMATTSIPTLHVGGYYDQEDLNGPQAMYAKLEKSDSLHYNYLVLGPWNHGLWAFNKGDSLGKIAFGRNTAADFQALQRRWFDYWLKGTGEGNFPEAICFQTGRNTWQTYNSWSPTTADIRRLYVYANGTAGFTRPVAKSSKREYVSDPKKPVPYRTQPIESTFDHGSRWSTWHVEDQRFVSSRPDVLSFEGDSLVEDLTVTGKIKAHIIASTTASDADFVVKLIDVYPDIDSKNKSMSGYQLPVAMEVLRARFRKNLDKPQPMTPGKPEEMIIDLHDINHTFLKGHKLMIQIQSSWFPVIDLNPQKYVANIFEAKETDFIKATHTIYCNQTLASYIELPVPGK